MKKNYFLTLLLLGFFINHITLQCVEAQQLPGASINGSSNTFSRNALCNPIYLDSIYEYKPGTLKNGFPLPNDRNDPQKSLGAPGTPLPLYNCFASLGFDDGYIIAAFAAPVKDSIIIWEGSYPKDELIMETASVWGSLDGVTYNYLGEANNADKFDTDSIHATTIMLNQPVKFIKLINTTLRSDPNQRGIDDGFDLDAIGASNYAAEYLLSAIGDLNGCEGDQLLLSAPKGYSYQWLKNNLPISGIVDYADTLVSTAGSYRVIIIENEGCKDTSDAIILNRAILPVAGLSPIGPLEICSSEGITLTASGTGSYQWIFNGAPINNVTTKPDTVVLLSGEYKVIVTNADGCKDTSDVLTLNRKIKPEQPITKDSIQVCTGQIIKLTSASSTNGVTYRWTGPSGFTSNQQNPILTNASQEQSGIYTVVAELNGCLSDVAQVKVDVVARPIVSLGSDRAICETVPLILDAGVNEALYLWNTGATTKTITVTEPGQYSVTVILEGGCSSSDTISLNLEALPLLTLSNDTSTCFTDPIMLEAGSNVAVTYLWSNGHTGTSLFANQSGTYKVTITTAGGCSVTDSVKVDFLEKPLISLEETTSGCTAKKVKLDAGKFEGATYLWSNGAKTQTIEVSAPGTYTVTVTGKNGCQAQDSTVVNFISAPALAIAPLGENCANAKINITCTGIGEDIVYEWTGTGIGTFDRTDAASIFYTPSAEEKGEVKFMLKATNQCGTYYDTVSTTLGEFASADFTASSTNIYADEPVTFTIKNIKSNTAYKWYFGNGQSSSELQPSTSFAEPGQYRVMLIALYDNTCPDTSYVDLDVSVAQIIFVPNVFSPESTHPDNRALKVFGTNIQFTDFSFRVFNRWGQMVYQANNFEQASQQGWNGITGAGSELESVGVYTWIVKGKFADGTEINKAGTASLIR